MYGRRERGDLVRRIARSEVVTRNRTQDVVGRTPLQVSGARGRADGRIGGTGERISGSKTPSEELSGRWKAR